MDILVTIYILTYQKFNNIYRCIDSALCQSYSNIELIVSDDGSTAFPEQEISDYIAENKHANIKFCRVIANKINVGTVKHINNILRIAQGKLFIPLAGDDVFYNENVISQIVENYERTHFNVLTTSRICVDESNTPICLHPHFKSRKIIEEMAPLDMFVAMTEMKDMHFLSGCAMVIAADFFFKLGMHDENFILWEDGPFATKVLSKGYKIETDYKIVSVKYHTGGVSSGGNQLMKKDMVYYNSKYRNLLSEQLGFIHKRRMTYNIKRSVCGRFYKYFLYFIYFDVVLDKFQYKIQECLRSMEDSYHY